MASSLVTGAAYSPHVTGWFCGGAALGAAYGATDLNRVSNPAPLVNYICNCGLLSFLALNALGFWFGQSALGAVALAMGSAAFVIRCSAFTWRPLRRVMNTFPTSKLMLTLRGFGWWALVSVVLLPLYVMVMSSLTTQQALYQNPLDLWPDFEQGL